MNGLTRKQASLVTVILLLIIATVCFIFSNSMEDIPESSAKSEKILRALTPALELLFGENTATNHLVRKLAHFTEFFVLGIELCVLCGILRKSLVWALFTGLCIALADETIQIFYERGSRVQDVWLDFSAVITAAILVFLYGVIIRRRKERR